MFTTELPDIYILNQVHGAHAHTHKITVTCESSFIIREIPLRTVEGYWKHNICTTEKKMAREKMNVTVSLIKVVRNGRN